MIHSGKDSLSRTLIIGGISGLAGAWAMSQFTRAWNVFTVQPKLKSRQPGLPYSQQEWDATSQIAQIVACRTLGRKLSASERCAGAEMVHYAVGATTGAAYAVLTRKVPQAAKSRGAFLGAVVFIANQLILPASGIIRPSRHYSWRDQANSLGEHIAYALTAETIRRTLQRTMP